MNDVVLAAAVGGIAGVLGGVIGMIGSALFAWRQDIGRGRRAAAADQEARIRTVRLEAIEATRRYMVDQLDWGEAFVILRDADARGPSHEDSRRANITLVGRFDIAKAYSDRLVELMEQAPITRLEAIVRYWRPRTLAEIDPEELTKTAKVRSDVIGALEEQILRLHRGEPLLELSDEELASLPGPQAFVDMLRRRTEPIDHRPAWIPRRSRSASSRASSVHRSEG
jgi:hypothetical protein